MALDAITSSIISYTNFYILLNYGIHWIPFIESILLNQQGIFQDAIKLHLSLLDYIDIFFFHHILMLLITYHICL